MPGRSIAFSRPPRYGEHFGRYWLDAVRYADTHGLHLDNIRIIWPYRDWVVGAFNCNLPFDRFTIEQLAGDLLPHPDQDQLVASGYNRTNLTTSEGGAIVEEGEARNTADRVNTTATVWLGLTAGCASCHDHKFDPLTQREYYSLGAFFKGLADHVWDANFRQAGPRILIGDAAQQRRIDALQAALPKLERALAASAEALATEEESDEPEAPDATDQNGTAEGSMPAAKPEPVTYEVVWAEDGDVPIPDNVFVPPPPGSWQEGASVPVAGGRRALRLEGATERTFAFASGEVPLVVRTAAKAFVHFYADPIAPPRAVSLEFVAGPQARTIRFIWGDPTAFAPEVVARSIVVGGLPEPGAYARLELDACDGGVAPGQEYEGLQVAQSDGRAWWDHAGMVCTSPTASQDPLLSSVAWARSIRGDESMLKTPLPLDIKFRISITGSLQTPADKEVVARFHRLYIHGPTRGVLEPEAHAARRVLAELVHFEQILPSSPISRERAKPRPAHVLIRGQYDQPGEAVCPATPAFLPPMGPSGPQPNRLDLARWLVDDRNPLTARVAVNRVWQQIFGAGLVRTPSDFGTQGDPPTHPRLLDWLAAEFRDSGWDVKALVRRIVISRTYRQDSAVAPEVRTLDPENRLLARGPRLRLDAEVLRDQALALGGLLRPEIGGPPVRPYQPTNIWEPVAFGGSNTRVYVPDKGDALYHRSLYTFWKRTAPPPAMTIFDAPPRETACVFRGRSNTPLQALALMNDVQQFEAARAFAARLLAKTRSDADRLIEAFRRVTARFPIPDEQALLAETLADHRAHFARDPEAAARVLANGASRPADGFEVGEFAAWTMIGNLLLNLDETVTRP